MSDTPQAGPVPQDTQTLTTDEKATAGPPQAEGGKKKAARSARLWSDAWYDLRRRPMFIFSLILIAILLVMSF